MDYKQLLIKYIAHVEDSEGINFISRIRQGSGGCPASVPFTEAEEKEMYVLEIEAQKLLHETK